MLECLNYYYLGNLLLAAKSFLIDIVVLFSNIDSKAPNPIAYFISLILIF